MKIGAIIDGISSDCATVCEVLKDTGVRYAEFQSCNGKRIEQNTVAEAKECRNLLDAQGIAAACVTTHAFVGIPVSTIEIGDNEYGRQLDLLKNGIAIARELGAPFVRTMTFTKTIVTWGYHGADKWNAGENKSWGKFIDLFRPLVELAESEDIDLLVENCFNSMNTSAALTKKMIEDLDTDRVKLLWDPANAFIYHEFPTLDVYESVKHLIAHIHIKDAIVDSIMSTVDFCPIGSGMFAPYLSELAGALRRDGYDGVISLENVYRPDGQDFIDGYYTDIPALKRIFG